MEREPHEGREREDGGGGGKGDGRGGKGGEVVGFGEWEKALEKVGKGGVGCDEDVSGGGRERG